MPQAPELWPVRQELPVPQRQPEPVPPAGPLFQLAGTEPPNGNANAALPIGLETTTLSQRAATLATAHSDAKGAFSATIIVPALKPGIYELTVYGVSCDDGGGSSCAGVIGRQVTVLG